MDALALNQRLTAAEDEIKAVECQLAAVERGLLEHDADIVHLQEEKKQLRDERKQLREKERLILELILRQNPAVGRYRKSAKRGLSQDLSRGIISTLILVTIWHPEREHTDVVNEELKEFVARKNGFIDDNQTVSRCCYGTLDPVVKVHKGTARRCDSFKSWEDEDAKSGSTYFNAPNPLRKTSHYSMKVD